MIFVRNTNEIDLCDELTAAWKESEPSRPGSVPSNLNIGLCLIENAIRRVCLLPDDSVRLVDLGLTLKNVDTAAIRKATQQLVNIPTQSIPVVLADNETLSGTISRHSSHNVPRLTMSHHCVFRSTNHEDRRDGAARLL